MGSFPITADGFERLQVELKQLKNEERPAVIKAIAAAREHGDLSENAEYHAARERQSFIEGRIAELEDKLRLQANPRRGLTTRRSAPPFLLLSEEMQRERRW